MSIKEVLAVRKSFLRRREMRRRDIADMSYRLSVLIRNDIQCSLSREAEPIQFLDIYKDLFIDESIDREEQQIKAKLEVNKQHMKEYAERVNRERSKKGGGENI